MRVAICALLCGLLAGCGLFWDDPYVTVTTHPLNWVEIHYYNATLDPVTRASVRIAGTGFVEVKSGTSKRVSDSFAKNMADATWEDFHTQQKQVSPEHVRELFQELVNAGLFDKDKVLRSTKFPSRGRFIAVRAAIDGKTFSEPQNLCEEDPELAEHLINIVHEFKRPTLGRKRASAKKAPEAAEKKENRQ